MIRNVLEHIHGIATLPSVALVLFLCVFVGMGIWAIRLSRTYINHMGNLPLEKD